ncbi:MAG: hypothetical protein AAGG75_03580 [Bacteroidota bacterium]
MRKNHLLTTLLCLLLTSAIAQETLRIGQWRSHLPYQSGRYVTQSNDKVYYASEWAVLSLDKEERSVDFLSKVDGLSEAGTSIVKYSTIHDALFVTYVNSDFDLVTDDGISTFANIRTNGNFFNREINDIYLADNGMAYFATGFGIVEFDIAEQVFGFTANLGIEVFNITDFNNQFYAATEEGVYTAPSDGSANLLDVANWDLLGSEDGFPAVYVVNVVQEYEGKLYVDIDDVLYTYDGSQLTRFYEENGFEVRFMTAEGQHLLVGLNCVSNCSNDKVLSFDAAGNFEINGSGCVNEPLYAIEDQFGHVWYADNNREYRVAETRGGSCNPRLTFNSPFNQRASDLLVDDGILYVATEPTRNSPIFTTSGFYSLVDGQWSTYNQEDFSILNNSKAFYRLAVHPENNKLYVGTFWDGLIEFDPVQEQDQLTILNDLNTTLQHSSLDPNVIRVGGVAFDNENNLWMSNHTAQNPISVLKSDGTWMNNFPRATPVLALRQLTIDQDGNKWFSIDGSSQALFLYNEGVLDDPTDDRSRFINSSNSELPSNVVNDITVDLDGDVWVGTTLGAVVFECGSSALESNCRGSRRIVEVDNIAAFLLEDENVLAVAVDGANRKWFGTENGVFVQSASGEEQVAFFNEDNSPLFDDVVSSIAINPVNGEVFMGTAKGIISYRSDAIEGQPFRSNNAYAFPNPVRSDYTGPIAIRGLARNADVKITDVNGQLVFETQALGGQAIWDGRDYNGRKAASGVYLVFSTSTLNRETPEGIVTKILLMN